MGTTRASNLGAGRYMAASGPATPPAGFLDFCARSPRDCGLRDEAGPALAPVAAIGASDTPAAGPRPQGFYDWSTAFAAARPAPPPASVQTTVLRQQLYGQMWQAAFAAARPQPVIGEEAPAIGAERLRPAVIQAPASAFAPAQPYLVNAAYVSAPAAMAEPAYEQAPSASDPAYAEPAAAAVAAIQPLAATRSLMAELAAVDRRINRLIVQTDDIRLYGQDDYWATPIEDALSPRGVVRGDCEDYVLEKRRALIAAGIPAEALSIAVADTRFGPHAVLLVDTDRGELVLDSLTGKIVTWERTGYRWVKRQAWGDPMSWVNLARN